MELYRIKEPLAGSRLSPLKVIALLGGVIGWGKPMKDGLTLLVMLSRTKSADDVRNVFEFPIDC